MVEERVPYPFFDSRSSGDDYQRRFFRICLRCGIDDLQAADGVGDAHSAYSPYTCVGISGIARIQLVARRDKVERTIAELLEKAEHVIPWHSEDV